MDRFWTQCLLPLLCIIGQSNGLTRIEEVPSTVAENRVSNAVRDPYISLAGSLSSTGYKFLSVSNPMKAVAAFGAVRALLLGCNARDCDLARASACAAIAFLAADVDRPASCCAAAEALAATAQEPEARQAVVSTLQSKDLDGFGCASVDRHGSKRGACSLLPMVEQVATLMQPVIRGSSLRELFGQHADINTRRLWRDAVHDLKLRPVARIGAMHWSYDRESPRQYPDNPAHSTGGEFVDMFHSCVPQLESDSKSCKDKTVGKRQSNIDAYENGENDHGDDDDIDHDEDEAYIAERRRRQALSALGALRCVWRRHPVLFSEHGSIYTGTITSINATRLSAGEDPRLFELAPGRLFYSMQRGTDEVGKRFSATASERVFRNVIVDVSSGQTTTLQLPRGEPQGLQISANKKDSGKSFAPDGKNWTPFVHNGELHFIFTLVPLRLLKCDHHSGKCSWLKHLATRSNTTRDAANATTNTGSKSSVKKKTSFKKKRSKKGGWSDVGVGVLRGGSAAHVLSGRYVIGFGHATVSPMLHTPFLYVIDLIDHSTRFSFMSPSSAVTPFVGYSILDPTSFWQRGDSLFVMCTARAVPDYMSFEQHHHQTVVFKASSSLLSGFFS